MRTPFHAQFLYFMSSFFGQFGPNATTWLLPGEVFPTDIRATCHGISAATGKVGALVAGIWFAYLTNAGKFYVAAFFNLVSPSAWQLPHLHTLVACRLHKGLGFLQPVPTGDYVQPVQLPCSWPMYKSGMSGRGSTWDGIRLT